jgi:hypothetical protein
VRFVALLSFLTKNTQSEILHLLARGTDYEHDAFMPTWLLRSSLVLAIGAFNKLRVTVLVMRVL